MKSDGFCSLYEGMISRTLRLSVTSFADRQSPWEKGVTEAINASKVGPLGLGGSTTALGTFIKIGPLRASGVRIVSMRPGCCFEPRKATVVLGGKG